MQVNDNGGVSWARTGIITASCNLKLSNFPYDKQTCNFIFYSTTYETGFLKLEPVLGLKRSPVVKDNLSWKTTGVSSVFSITSLPTGAFSTFTVSVSVERFAHTYESTCVMPNALISTIAVFALFITDVGARLSVSLTALLTVIAVMWTTSSKIPYTEEGTWLEKFSNACVYIIFIVSMECVFVEYVASRKGKAPDYLRSVVNLASPSKMKSFLASCFNKQNEKKTETNMELSNIQNHSANSSVHSNFIPEMYGLNPLTGEIENITIQKGENNTRASQLRPLTSKDMDLDDLPFGWPKLSSAVDRISKVIIVVSYSAIFIYFLSPQSRS